MKQALRCPTSTMPVGVGRRKEPGRPPAAGSWRLARRSAGEHFVTMNTVAI